MNNYKQIINELDKLSEDYEILENKCISLVRLIEQVFEKDFGEFSNRNNPIDRAIDYMEGKVEEKEKHETKI